MSEINVNDEFDNSIMKIALTLAKEASHYREVPVGAVVVCDGKVISTGRNRREGAKNALCHAEIEAIDKACKVLGGWRLHKCDLYVTLEPCPMCAGAIVNARIKRVVFGAQDKKAGAFGGVFDINSFGLNHKPEIVSGVQSEACSACLTEFFRTLRL